MSNEPTKRIEEHAKTHWGVRRAVIKRNGGLACEECGRSYKKSTELFGNGNELHHITPVREFDDESKAHVPSNAVLLCPECHQRAEWGSTTTDHDITTEAERAVVELISQSEGEVQIDQVLNSIELSEGECRAVISRMISGGHIGVTADWRLTV